MEARVTEVADGVHQLSTFVGAPVGFNQYLITADEPMLIHTGMRQMPTARSVAWCRSAISPTARHEPSPTVRRSTSGATPSSGSTRPTFPTRGRRACSTT